MTEVGKPKIMIKRVTVSFTIILCDQNHLFFVHFSIAKLKRSVAQDMRKNVKMFRSKYVVM